MKKYPPDFLTLQFLWNAFTKNAIECVISGRLVEERQGKISLTVHFRISSVTCRLIEYSPCWKEGKLIGWPLLLLICRSARKGKSILRPILSFLEKLQDWDYEFDICFLLVWKRRFIYSDSELRIVCSNWISVFVITLYSLVLNFTKAFLLPGGESRCWKSLPTEMRCFDGSLTWLLVAKLKSADLDWMEKSCIMCILQPVLETLQAI